VKYVAGRQCVDGADLSRRRVPEISAIAPPATIRAGSDRDEPRMPLAEAACRIRGTGTAGEDPRGAFR
jgi:hypothetical protein